MKRSKSSSKTVTGRGGATLRSGATADTRHKSPNPGGFFGQTQFPIKETLKNRKGSKGFFLGSTKPSVQNLWKASGTQEAQLGRAKSKNHLFKTEVETMSGIQTPRGGKLRLMGAKDSPMRLSRAGNHDSRMRLSMTRENLRKNSRLMSREKRLQRYSRRTEQRSVLPGGGIKLKFGEMRRSKATISLANLRRRPSQSNKSVDMGNANGSAKRRNPANLNQTVNIKIGENQKKAGNIFGDFMGQTHQNSPRLTLGNTKLIKKANVQLEASSACDRYNFDTNSQSGEEEKASPAPGAKKTEPAEWASANKQLKAKIDELDRKVRGLEKTVEQQKEIIDFYKQKGEGQGKNLREAYANLQTEKKNLLIQYNAVCSELKRAKEALTEEQKNCDAHRQSKEQLETNKRASENQKEEDAKRDAENIRALENKIAALETTAKKKFKREGELEQQLLQRDKTIRELCSQKAKLESENTYLEAEKIKHITQREKDQTKVCSLEKEHQDGKAREQLQKDHTAQLEAQLRNAHKTAETERLTRLEAEEKLLAIQEDCESLRVKLEKLRNEADTERSEAVETMGRLKQQIVGLTEKLEEWKQQWQAQKEQDSGAAQEELEVLRYENDKMRKNNKLLELKLKEVKAAHTAAENTAHKRDKELHKAKSQAQEREAKGRAQFEELQALRREFENLRKAKQSIEKDLSRSMTKIGNSLQIINGIKLKSKDKNLLMNALIGV